MMFRFITSIVGMSTLLAIIFSAAPAQQEPRFTRTDYELCQEVERELLISVERGTLTEQEARRTADRCFDLFAGGR